MEEVGQSNPKYQHPNKYFQQLVELLESNGEGGPYWHSVYIGDYCNIYGKDYEKIHRCYYAYATCEKDLPLTTEYGTSRPDLFADNPGKEYKRCLEIFKPDNWRQELWFWIGKTFFNGRGY